MGLLQTRPLRTLHVLGFGLRQKLGVTNPRFENPLLIASCESTVFDNVHGRGEMCRRVQDSCIDFQGVIWIVHVCSLMGLVREATRRDA